MTLRDDPRLTAYALGECTEAERAEVEALLATDPAARVEVAAIRDASSRLSAALAIAPAAALPADARPRIEAAAAAPRRRLWLRWSAGVAAAAAAVVVAGVVLHPRHESARHAGKDPYLTANDAGAYVPPGGPAPRISPAPGYPKLRSALEPEAKPRLREPSDPTPPPPAPPGAKREVPDGLVDRLDAVSEDRRSLLSAGEAPNTEAYDALVENEFLRPTDAPLSTFSIDVDTASYSNVRRFLNEGRRPPPGAVRVEELVNYFRYRYEPPRGDDPFAVHLEVATCPWDLKHRLVRIGLKGREIERTERPASNLVFLLDVSGSMNDPQKLPLVKASLRMLVEEWLGAQDRVSIVVYAGASGLVLPPTAASERGTILAAIGGLSPGGSTNGAAGIRLAYEQARAAFLPDGNNRVVLATDGDFNVGVTSQDELVRLIEEQAKSGVFLTVLGYGMGNLKDSTLEKLADKGNGNYGYVDGLREARKLLVEEATGTMVTIAKDVKVQVEFNPAVVAAYRLVGYENRRLAAQDFNDDTKDAGEIGAGHTVTALYEVVPAGETPPATSVDPLRYQSPPAPGPASASGETLTVKLRWKEPTADTSRLREVPLSDSGASYDRASEDFKFAAAVAAFAQVLRESRWKGTASYEGVLELAGEAVGTDEGGYRTEFLDLVRKASAIR